LAWKYEEELQKIGDERFLSYELHGNTATPRRRVRRLSYLPREHLVALMRGARALLFPSLYEGFGLPVLEAMSVGTPVMTSNVTSLPEVAGDAALLVDPLDTDDIARGIRTLDNDSDLRAELRQRGLQRAALCSPEAYQRRIAALYRSVIG
jgi:glycosyltransferase involved in cell wall biosynthesis